MTIAYWCILIAAFIPWFCAAYAKKTGGFKAQDNQHPRAFMANLQGAAARANAAQSNGYEIFPLFAAAVLIAHATNANMQWVNVAAVIFVISRIVFSYLYITNLATLRSLAWFVGLLSIIALFVLSA